MRNIRWGIIGVGSVAEHKSGPAFSLAHGGELVGVASRNYESAAVYAQRHGISSVFPTPLHLIQSEAIDAVYIATPPSSHVGLALKVAEARKPCCIEKPMAVLYKEAQLALEAFEEAAMPLFVSYYRRSLPRFTQIAQWLRNGEIGKVREVHWHLNRTPAPQNTTHNWRVSNLEAPGGLFEDLACHGLDFFDFIIGPITSIDSAHLESTNGAPVPDLVEATWRHGADVRGTGKWNFSAHERGDSVTIVGGNGHINFSMFEDSQIILRGHKKPAEIMIHNPVPIQLHHVEAMNRHVSGQIQHPSTAQSAIRTAWATEQILHGQATTATGLRPIVLSAP